MQPWCEGGVKYENGRGAVDTQQLRKLACAGITGARRTTLTARKAGLNLRKLEDSSGVQTDR